MIFRIGGYIYLLEIFLCLLFSILFYKRGTKAEKCLVPFFACLLCIEMIAYVYVGHVVSIRRLYNFWFPVEFIFYSFFVTSFINSASKRKGIIWGTCIYTGLVAVEYIFFIPDLNQFATTPYLVGTILILPVLLMKLHEILNNEIMDHPLRNPLFWFITALLIVNIGGFFVMGSINYLLVKDKNLFRALSSINTIAACLQYFFFLLYFYCKWKYLK